METITLGSQWNKELIAVTAAVTDNFSASDYSLVAIF